jgi:membrane carboxypeptidase/penicillin-binding protein
LSLIQEGLRGVVCLPTGTAHALASRGFPLAVLGKTGTTSDFRDAIFVGSTCGPDGITAAVRIGLDDNRSLGSRETGRRLALPVFQELILSVYREQIVGPRRRFRRRWKTASRSRVRVGLRLNKRFQRDDNTKFRVNIVVYATTA